MAEVQVEPVTDGLRDRLEDLLANRGGLGEMEPLSPPKAVSDDPAKILLLDRQGRPAAVLKLSSPAYPDLVHRSSENILRARDLLGPVLGEALPTILLRGEVEGRSFMVLAYGRPFSRSRWGWFLQRVGLSSLVLQWLWEVTAATCRKPAEDEVERDFREPLRWLASKSGLDGSLREEAKTSLRLLDQGGWGPRYVLAHNDLWRDNLLLRRPTPGEAHRAGGFGRLLIIDWGGARLQGHPFYDLMRLGQSLGISKRRWRLEIRRHLEVLGTDEAGGRALLLSGLGYLGLHRDHFPMERYLECASSCWASWMGLEA
jgi:hypothetical protein